MNQEKSLAILKSGKNVFLTGSAGTGKTYLLEQYVSYLRQRQIRVAVTASTGIAATHMRGQTIHSWSGMGVRDHIELDTLKKIYKYRHLRKNMDKVQVLVLDEISMLHQNQFTVLDRILRFFKGVEVPFGGVQLVISGDFFQLPPVTRDRNANSRERFAFMSPSWVTCKPVVCYLDKQYRQKDDQLISLLADIRRNEIDESTINQLDAARSQTADEDTLQLYTHNMDVDSINKQRLGQLEGEERSFNASGQGKDNVVEILSRSILAPATLVLKQEAKVLFVKNNPDAGYMNGTLGRVVGFSKKGGLPRVEIDQGGVICVEPETWTMENDEGAEVATFTQLPLRLAWAITVHKSQGMTLDQAKIDLSHAFEKGQGYVALSRLRSYSGLSLDGYNETALQIDSWAFKADTRFQELSEEVDGTYTFEDLETGSTAFISRCKGVLLDEEGD